MASNCNEQDEQILDRTMNVPEKTTGRRGFLSTLAGVGAALSMPLGAGDATAAPITSGPAQNSYTLESPDGSVVANFELSGGSLSYSLLFDGMELISSSNIGVDFEGATLDGNLEVTGSQTATHDETWKPVWDAYDQIRNNYNQLEIGLAATDTNHAMTIEARAFDDGLGFRYVFPEESNLGSFTITSENTGFEFAGDYESWWIPNDWDNSEYYAQNTPVSEVSAVYVGNHNKTSKTTNETRKMAERDGVTTPFTIRASDNAYMSIHEAALTDYAGMTVAKNEGTSFESALVPHPDSTKVHAQAPHASPWRTFRLGRSAGDLVESRLVLNLNEPSKIDDSSWIEPGNYCGVWWANHIGKHTWGTANPGATTENVKRYMDFASKHGINSVLFEGWNEGWGTSGFGGWGDYVWTKDGAKDHIAMQEVADYGHSLDPPVDMVIHNETLSEVESYEAQMDEAYSWYSNDLGASAIKSGYVGEDGVQIGGELHHHHDQTMVNHYRLSAQTAAEYQLMLNIHEPIKPTGVRRTYPNIMTREGMPGQEYENFKTGNHPDGHMLTLPFRRMLAGPMDYTPGIFDVFYEEYDGGLQSGNNRVRTTRARQLALYPIYFSGLQMLADLPEHYQTSHYKGGGGSGPPLKRVDLDIGNTVQAEWGTLTNLATGSKDDRSFQGDSYVEFNPDVYSDSGAIEWTAPSIGSEGQYDFHIRFTNDQDFNYHDPNTDRTLALIVNGERVTTITFGFTDGWSDWQVHTESVALDSGENVIKLADTGPENGGVNVDSVALTESGQSMPDPPVEGGDDPGEERETPKEFDYIKNAPASWDDTKVITATIGEEAAFARRKGEEWWIGISRLEAGTVDVPLADVLDDGIEYAANIYTDGPNCDFEKNPHDVAHKQRLINTNTTISEEQVYRGGTAIRAWPASDTEKNELEHY